MSVLTAATDQSFCAPLPVLGKDVTVPLVTGGEVTYAALDYAASAPALQRVWDDVAAYAPYYGSVHRGRRLPLAAVHRPLREQPRHRRGVPRLPRRRPGGLHPVHHRLAQPARRGPARRLPGVRLRDRAPRLAAALARRPGDVPERPAHPGPGRRDPGARAHAAATPTGPRWSVSPAPPTSPASCGRSRSSPPPRTPTAPGSCSTPPSSPRTTPSTSPSWTSTGSRSPVTSCTRRSARASSSAAPTG